MVAQAYRLGTPLPWCVQARRAVCPDRRRIPRNDFVLLDPRGTPLGTVSSVLHGPAFGPLAPTVYLARDFSFPGRRPVMS
jgi:hypothetical protein